MLMRVVPIEVGTLGTVNKRLKRGLETLEIEERV